MVYIMFIVIDPRFADRRPVPIEIGRLRSLTTAKVRFFQARPFGISSRFPIHSSPDQPKNLQERNER
jgi:hypothetical protein